MKGKDPSDKKDHLRLGIVVAAVLGVFFLLNVFLGPQVVSELFTGWMRFSFRVLPQVKINWGGIVVFAVGFVLAVGCLHIIASWLVDHYQQLNQSRAVENLSEGQLKTRWTTSSSVAMVGIFLLLFVVSICMAGVVHQTGWIINSPEGFNIAKVQSWGDAKLANYDPNYRIVGDSWITACAPYTPFMLEKEQVRDKPFNDPMNAENYKRVLPVSICPSQGNPIFSPEGFGLSHVAANTRALGGKLQDMNVRAALLGEVNAAFDPWGSPSNHRQLGLGIRREWMEVKRGSIGFGSHHTRGANISLVDGSVIFVSENIDAEVLKQLGRVLEDGKE